jgi:large subunit ribosomal protein L32
MATPKRKTSHARRGNRQAHYLSALKAPSIASCPKCGESVQSYCACNACGYYRGHKVLKVAADKEKSKAK